MASASRQPGLAAGRGGSRQSVCGRRRGLGRLDGNAQRAEAAGQQGLRRDDRGVDGGRDDGVGPVVVARTDHDEDGDGRVEQDQPAPAAAGRGDDGPGDQDRPGDVDRRHGGQLVGARVRADHAVDRLAVPGRQVHDARAGEEPRRRDRDEGDQQADRGARGHRVAHRRVAVAVPDEQPDQHRDQHPEVHGRVVEVRDLRKQRVREQQALDV